MSDPRLGDQERELDWENLSGPVPMDLIDPEFAAGNPAGAESRILPRAESEALLRETGADVPPPEAAGLPYPAFGHAGTAPQPAPAHGPAEAPPQPAGPAPAFQAPEAQSSGNGTTLFGGITGEFNRIRAEMEAEAEAEKLRKQEAEREEAAQRARLEQWMANARARLLKADADLTGPGGRVRIRKESSPSLYRLAEMQKTMQFDGDATVPEGTRIDPPSAAPDPMATISVPTDQFLKLDTPPQPGLREQALARAAAQAQALAQSQAAASAPAPAEAREAAAHARPDDLPPTPSPAPEAHSGSIPSASGSVLSAAYAPPAADASAFRPMTREEALTRKVAKLRRAAEAGESTLVGAPTLWEEREGKALNFVIAAVVLVGLLVLGLGLFAATQAGLFDGMENRIPFLKPKVAIPAGNLPRPVEVPETRSAPAAAAPAAPGPAQSVPSAPATAASAASANAPIPAARPAEPVRAPAANIPAPQAAPKTAPTAQANRPAILRAASRPASARPGNARKAPGPARKNAPAAPAPDDEIPAYARPPDAAANAEAVLRNSVQAAVNADRESLHELYNSYALGFPGLSGEVVIGLTVDPSGRILEASIVSSTTGVTTFDQDLLRKVVLWRLRAFPESRPKFITVPFLFPMQGH